MRSSGEDSSLIEIQFQALREVRIGGGGEEGRLSGNCYSRSQSSTPRSRQNSPNFYSSASHSFSGDSSADPSNGDSSADPSKTAFSWQRLVSLAGSALAPLRRRQQQQRRFPSRRKQRGRRGLAILIGVVAFFLIMNWWMFSHLKDPIFLGGKSSTSNSTTIVQGERTNYGKGHKTYGVMYTRLLALAAHALAEADTKPEPETLWQEPFDPGSSWIACADLRRWKPSEGSNGYILVSANGGINQQRVAICNAVAIARLLNATLVIPKLLHSNVWQDQSQFSDIYQEEYFMSYLKDDIQIVKELPVELQSLDLEAIGSLLTDTEVPKESKPTFYLKRILPILLKNRVVHFSGFGNRLASDPLPHDLQPHSTWIPVSQTKYFVILGSTSSVCKRLRCRCNFHALQFVDRIQSLGALLMQRMHRHAFLGDPLEHNLLGPYAPLESKKNGEQRSSPEVSRFLAVHLRFEIDMAAYSMCYFGGGEEEEEELEAYRAAHFPQLALIKKEKKIPSSAFLRSEGRCPLTPEESVLMLAALGFNHKTSVYVAGAEIYGGKSRMAALRSLYPKLATKETLLSSSEIEPFLNYSSQLAALDFIVCSAADVFAMTDPGSQFSALVSGYRMYYGGGNYPTIRPNKRRLVSVFSRNSTIEWKDFEHSVRKAARQDRKVEDRPIARSIYRHPRCPECMCLLEQNDDESTSIVDFFN